MVKLKKTLDRMDLFQNISMKLPYYPETEAAAAILDTLITFNGRGENRLYDLFIYKEEILIEEENGNVRIFMFGGQHKNQWMILKFGTSTEKQRFFDSARIICRFNNPPPSPASVSSGSPSLQ